VTGPGELHPPEGPWAAEGVVTRARQTSWPYVPTAFVDSPGRTLTADELIGAAVTLGAERLMVCGDADVFAQPGADTRVESVATLGGQAVSTPRGHHLTDPAHPIFRWWTPAGSVEVMRAAVWFGEDVSADVARQAWLRLGQLIRAAFGGGSRLLSTPGTTGRDLWLRTIPSGRSYPVLSPAMREFLARTTTQGRVEWRGTELAGQTVDLTVWDARFAYAKLLANLPDPASTTLLSPGAVQTLPADALDGHLRGRGRWRVTFTPPGWWELAGLLPVAREGTHTGWDWPTGGTHTTWADSCEVELARRAGWHVTVLEGVVWGEAKVAETWVRRLDTIRQGVSDDPVGAAVAAGVRAMVIQTIGGWASRSHPVTRVGTPDQRPHDREVRDAGRGLVTWQEAGSTAWGDTLRHPEWAHTVWARARRALLSTTDASGKLAGALHLPNGCSLLGVRTDALYLTGPAPTWTDDGRTGRLRLKPDQSGRFTIGATPWRLTP
jgi:hypothetical protein